MGIQIYLVIQWMDQSLRFHGLKKKWRSPAHWSIEGMLVHGEAEVTSRVVQETADDDLHADAVELEFYLYLDHDGLMVTPRHSPTGTILHQAGPQFIR